MKDRYVPIWEQATYSDQDLRKVVEETREHFRAPLTHAYHALAEQEFGEGQILFLGIGSGNEVGYSGIAQERVTGVDVSPTFLNTARMRIPQARLVQGKIQDILPQMEQFPVTVASEMLDCINTQELPEVLGQVRDTTDKLIITQSFTPDYEFYCFKEESKSAGSYGGPGIEGWTDAQSQAVENRLQQLGVKAPITSPTKLLQQLQHAAEVNTGNNRLAGRLVDMMKESRLDPENIPVDKVQDMFGDRPYPSQIQAFIEILARNIAPLRNQARISARTEDGVAQYVKLHTTHRIIQLLNSSLILDYHFTILEHELKTAGFENIERTSIAASASGIISDEQVTKDLNKCINAAKSLRLPLSHLQSISSKVFVNGSPLTFVEPHRNPVNDARIQYIRAE